MNAAEEKIVCPGCGGENPADAVFCGNPACHKALGEFEYVTELVAAEARWHEKLAEKGTAFIGKPHFVIVHLLWFAVWIVLNSGLVMAVSKFDAPPFALLGIILAAEAIFMSGFVLITQNRQNHFTNKRAELDYEVNVRTYREIIRLQQRMNSVVERLERAEGTAHSETDKS